VPLDRVFNKANNISAAMGEDAETWQRVALMLGWPEWQLKTKAKQEEQGIKRIERSENNKKEIIRIKR